MFDQNSSASSLAAISSHNSKMKHPMSKNARKLLDAMMSWVKQFCGGQIWTGIPQFIADFDLIYSPIIYEDVCHKYKTDTYISALSSKNKKTLLPGPFKTKDDVLNTMMLKHFNNHVWIYDNSIADNDRRVSILSTEKAANTYNWLTTNFLVSDFSEDDLNKIAAMGDDTFNIDTIKREASRITDIHKHNVAYLYAIVRDIAIREEYISRQNKILLDKQSAKLNSIIQLELECQNKITHESESDYKKQWELNREFAELARSIKKTSG